MKNNSLKSLIQNKQKTISRQEGYPSQKSGRDGDFQVRRISGEGIFLFYKWNNKWYSSRLTQYRPKNAEHKQSVKIPIGIEPSKTGEITLNNGKVSVKKGKDGNNQVISVNSTGTADTNTIKFSRADTTTTSAGSTDDLLLANTTGNSNITLKTSSNSKDPYINYVYQLTGETPNWHGWCIGMDSSDTKTFKWTTFSGDLTTDTTPSANGTLRMSLDASGNLEAEGTLSGSRTLASDSDYVAVWDSTTLKYRTKANFLTDLGISSADILDWTVSQDPTVIHADNYTDTNQLTTFIISDGSTTQTIAQGNTITFAEGEGINVAVSATDTVTVTAEEATSINKGVAAFSTDNFLVSSGSVTIKDLGVDTDEIAARAVTYAKMQNVTDARMLGNNSGGAASPTEMTKANVLSFLNVADGATANTGDITGVTAGTNCSGGGTSGGVTINVDDAFIVNDADDTMAGTLTIDKNSTATTSGTTNGVLIDFDHTGITASGQTIYNKALSVDFLNGSPTHVGTHNNYGIQVSTRSNTTGTSTNYGIENYVTGADTNYGIYQNIVDGGIDYIQVSSADVADYFSMATIASGATTLTTVDSDATIAHLTLDADGDIILDAASGNITVKDDGGNYTPSSDYHIATKKYVDDNDADTTYSAGSLLDLSTTTFNVDLTEAAEAAIADGDYILFLDGGATGSHAKEAVADLATLFAGTSLTASNSVIGVDDDFIKNDAADIMEVSDFGAVAALKIDADQPATTAAEDSKGLWIDYDRTVASSGTNAHNDIGIDLDVNTASLGTSSAIGLDIDVVGATSGTHTSTGLDINVSGSDSNHGLDITVADTTNDYHMRLFAADDVNDYATICLKDTGDLEITTVDSASTEGDIQITADGDVTLKTDTSAGKIVLDATSGIELDAASSGGSTTYLKQAGETWGYFSRGNISSDVTMRLYEGNNIGDELDYFEIEVAEHGDTTIKTVDDNAAIAHLKFEPDGSFLIKETASAGADVAGYGQLWVKSEAPNELYFTNDDGDDIQITDGTSLAGGGGGASALNDLSDVTFSSNDLTIPGLDKIIFDTAVDFDLSGDVTFTENGAAFSFLTLDYNQETIKLLGNSGNTYLLASIFGAQATITCDDTLEIQADDMHFSNSALGTFGWGLNSGTYSEYISWDIVSNTYQWSNSLDTDDYYKMTVGTHGATTLATVCDSGDNAANLTLDVDGDIELNADGGNITFKDNTADLAEISGSGILAKTIIYFDAETANTIGDGATGAIDWTANQKQKVTITGTGITCNFTNPTGPCNLLLKVIQGDGSDVIGTWDSDIKWAGGTAPTLSTGNGEIDILSFYFDGTNYFGVSSLDFQ